MILDTYKNTKSLKNLYMCVCVCFFFIVQIEILEEGSFLFQREKKNQIKKEKQKQAEKKMFLFCLFVYFCYQKYWNITVKQNFITSDFLCKNKKKVHSYQL